MNFSIVVPFFNAATTIERCAIALLSQRCFPHQYEILMVDNNSTDVSASLIQQFDSIRLLKQPCQGSYAARNRGICEARGDIVAFTDPDCVPEPDWLEQIARALEEQPTLLVLGDRRFASNLGVLGLLGAYESEMSARIFSEDRVEFCYAYTNNMAVRTSTLKALGGFRDVSRGADGLLMRSVLTEYGRSALKYAPKALVRHLEIATVRDYLRKKGIYGQVNRNPELATRRALPLSVRLELTWRARRTRGGSVADTLGFLGVLALGAVRFEWERRRGIGIWIS